MNDELRGQVIIRARGRCEWCQLLGGEEIAHAHSRGMGGNRKARDVIGNLLWLCRDCARMSDGEYGSGGARQYRNAHLGLLGPEYLEMDAGRIGYSRAEALRELIQ